jgi:hypothetical protein
MELKMNRFKRFGYSLLLGACGFWIPTRAQAYTKVITPNGSTLPWKMVDGVKEFHLTAEAFDQEFAPGMKVHVWGYNGQTPGPTIEAVEGDRVRILVTNHLPEATSVHWHGVLLPNGMDGVSGLTQKGIQPGETYAYEFKLRQHGTLMYHPHADETHQMAMGMEGFFIIHPKIEHHHIDRDFAIFLQEWNIPPGAFTPNPVTMLDFNTFTFNSHAYPGTAPLVVKKGDRVRIRYANLSMDSHPIHLHGFQFKTVATDGGDVPESAQSPDTTVNVPVGATRDVEFVADEPGDWALHCHKAHHAMNAMEHSIPNMTGVDQSEAQEKLQKLGLGGFMGMGQNGMGDMAEMNMQGPKNTLPMMAGQAKYGPVEMGGMFTILKVREGITSYVDPGNYQPPKGTVARLVGKAAPSDSTDSMNPMPHMQGMNMNMDNMQGDEDDSDQKEGTKNMDQPTEKQTTYSCPMHPEVRQETPGTCSKCGMTLKPVPSASDSKGSDMKGMKM